MRYFSFNVKPQLRNLSAVVAAETMLTDIDEVGMRPGWRRLLQVNRAVVKAHSALTCRHGGRGF